MSITLLYPWVLIFIFIYPIVIFLLSKFAKKRVFSNVKIIKSLKGRSISLDLFLYIVIYILLLLALAYPVKKSDTEIYIKSSKKILLLLDASASMKDDNRFSEAKKIISDFIKKRDKVALVVFGNRAYIASGFSSDISAINTIIKHLKPGVAGGRDTALYEAIYMGAKLFKDKDKDKSMILLTDGVDTIKDMPIDVVTSFLNKKGIKLYAIGIGKDYRKDILQKLAGSKGIVFNAKSSKELRDIYNRISALESAKLEKKSISDIKPLYRYLLILALFLILFLLIKQKKNKLLLFCAIFIFLALIYPQNYSINRATDTNRALAIVLDISYNMKVEDIPPNRWEYAKNRVINLIKQLPLDTKIALVAFDSRVYLISPPTDDKEVLIDKIEHLKVKMNRGSDSIIDALYWSDKLLKKYKKRDILLITASRLKYSKKLKDIKSKLSIYAVATLKGSAIPTLDGGYLEDNQGRVIVSYLDTNLAYIAKDKGGVFGSVENGADSWNGLVKNLSNSSIDDFEFKSDKRVIFLLISLAVLSLLASRIYRR